MSFQDKEIRFQLSTQPILSSSLSLCSAVSTHYHILFLLNNSAIGQALIDQSDLLDIQRKMDLYSVCISYHNVESVFKNDNN